MVTSWVISLAIIIFVRRLAGRPQIIPTRGQAVVENLLGGLRDIIEPIVGHRMIKVTFPLLIGFFIFILMQNWSGMLPGVGSVYYTNAAGEQVHLIRPGNADLNMTLGLALVHFVAWFYFVMRYAGPRALLYDVFGNKANPKEVPLPIYLFLFVIFLGVGMIELVSILFRNISLPFRLFGNVYGGENLIASMTGLIRYIVPVPFYFLEVLIGLVQALVFTLLVAVYIGLICNHEGGHEEEQHAAVE
jgi:F-type H+-transporting ATPase subunit a